MRILRVLFVIGAPVALYLGYEQYLDGDRNKLNRDNMLRQLAALQSEANDLRRAPAKPLTEREEALEELLTRLVDDTELLGSSVRLNLSPGGLAWAPVKHGVEKVQLSLASAAESNAGLGYFYILWKLIEERPASIIGGTIQLQGEVVSFNVDVELFGVAPGK